MTSRKDKRRVHRFAYDGLDRVIHERARLSLLTCCFIHVSQRRPDLPLFSW